MHVPLLSDVSSPAAARLAGSSCGFNFVCALCRTATASVAALLAHLSFASAVRSRRFARTGAGRFVADLLFRAAFPPSHLVLEASMEAGRLAKPNDFHCHLHGCTVAGREKRLLVCRDHQFATGFSLCKGASEVASESLGQNQRHPGPLKFQPDFERNRRSHAQFMGNPFGR